MSSIKDKLRSLPHIVRTNPVTSNAEPVETCNFSALEAIIVSNEFGNCVIREKRFSLDFVHCVRLREFLKLDGNDFTCISRDKRLTEISAIDVIFFDTETTGLAGGAGTYIFQAGAGFFDGDEFVVKQYFMRDYHEESALLAELIKDFSGKAALISFNGKTYDLPLLKTRLIMNRIPFKAELLPHLDLLHASRRLWRKKLESCSLQNIEREILQFYRYNDIPGAEIPALYFNYLIKRDFNPLVPVFKHNVMDILSMLSISVMLAWAFKTPHLVDPKVYDILNIVKTFDDLGMHTHAVQICKKFTEQNNHPEIIQLMRREALLQKKLENWQDAELLWLNIINRSRFFNNDVYLELAKYYEHQLKNIDMALSIIERAEKHVNIISELRGDYLNHVLNEFARRKERLYRKRDNIPTGEK